MEILTAMPETAPPPQAAALPATGPGRVARCDGDFRFGRLLGGMTASPAGNAGTTPHSGQQADPEPSEEAAVTSRTTMAEVPLFGMPNVNPVSAGADRVPLPEIGALPVQTEADGVALTGTAATGQKPVAAAAAAGSAEPGAKAEDGRREGGESPESRLVNAEVAALVQMFQQQAAAPLIRGVPPLPPAAILQVTPAVGNCDPASRPVVLAAPAAGAPRAMTPDLLPGGAQGSGSPLDRPAAGPASEIRADLLTWPAAKTELGDASPGTAARPAAAVDKAAFKQHLGDQGVKLASVRQPVDAPLPLDLPSVDLTVRGEGEPAGSVFPELESLPLPEGKEEAVSPQLVASAGHTAGKPVEHPESHDQEPAGSVSHEQLFLQVKEKLEKVTAVQDGGRVVLQLHPAELGELKIDLSMENLRLKVEIVTDNPTVKEALLQNMDNLRDLLSRQNITMGQFDVSTGGGNGQLSHRDGRQDVPQGTLLRTDPDNGRKVGEEEASRAALAAYRQADDYTMLNVRM